MEMSAVAIACCSALCAAMVICAWQVLNWVWLRPKKLERCLRQQGLSGNPYRLFHGDLKDLSTMTRDAMSKPIKPSSDDITPRIVPFQHHLLSKFGKKYYMWMGTTPKVTIMDPVLIREVLNNYKVFQKPRTNPLVRFLVNGVINLDGDQWHTRRKILNPAFHLDKLKHMLPAFRLSCEEMLRKWEKLMTESGSAELDVQPYLENLTGDVISRTAFGSSYEVGRKIFQLQNEQTRLFLTAVQSTYIPGYRFLPTKTNKRMKEIFIEVQAIIRDIITRREKAMKAGEAKNDDLLGIMMECNLKEIRENKKEMWMSIDDVIEECRLFYSAGQETTSNLLLWTILLLSKHSNWQERARSEVVQVFGLNQPDYEGLSRLKVVSMILNETLRLYPPAPNLERIITKETKLGELSLPAGVYVSLPVILVHHDQDMWGSDAKEFKPERFSEGVSGATKNKHAAFFPFSMGPRICIGQNFSLIEAKVALSMMLQRFSFELSPSYAHAPYAKLTLQPQYGAHIIMHKL